MSNVTTEHPQYQAMSSRWELCRAEFEGEHCMHEKGITFLPKLHDEEDDAYAARVKMTPFFNAYFRTISGLRGMMFRKPVVIEAPTTILEMLKDVDLAGTSLDDLAYKVAGEALSVGRVGLLVDYPEANPDATMADAQRLNLRPMIKMYKAEDIYNWRVGRVNNATVLIRVQLTEDFESVDAENEFKAKTEKRYRVLDLVDGVYRQRIFKKADNDAGQEQVGSDIFPKMNNKTMGFIPLVVIGADCLGIEVEAPPLIDLATTALHHYKQATSYERGCFFSGLPTMFVSGVNRDDTEIAIGGAIANILPRPDSKAYYVEVAGEFAALRTNLEDKKREMAVLGARMLEQQKANVESADTIARRQSGEESLLAATAQTISQGLTTALGWFSEWASATGDATVALNHDFVPAGMTSADLVALVGAWQSGAISQETLFNNLKAGEIIADDVTYEEEQEKIASATPVY
jgi:hypothetical protein